MKPSIRFLIALPLLAALHANASQTVKMIYRPEPGEAAPRRLVDGCLVNLVAVADARNNRETIGLYDQQESLLAGDALPWMGRALERLKLFGYRVERGAARDGAVNIDVRLTRAYTFSWWPYRGGMVAIELAGPAGPVKLRQMAFTGAGNSDGPQDYVTVLNRAADLVVDDLAKALKPSCAVTPAR